MCLRCVSAIGLFSAEKQLCCCPHRRIKLIRSTIITLAKVSVIIAADSKFSQHFKNFTEKL